MNNDFFVYMLKCNDGSYYVGHTDNLEKRIGEHSSGHGGLYIASRLPIQLIFVQNFSSRDEAFVMERKIKKF